MSRFLFAVVGHVNKGKSSIVSTLAEDDSVAIAREAGTTIECREFPLRIDGRTLFTLIDTPGFEQARHALAWLREHESGAAGRPAAVRRFLEEHAATGRFPEECKLLRPIVDGAGILYVVDGSRPYSPEYETEMEILAWTGQPRMALINRISEADHSESWRAALDQYFSIVREFNAKQAGFEERLKLLRAFRELREDMSAELDEAIAALNRERERRLRESCRAIAAMLADMLSLTLVERAAGDPTESQRENLEKRFLEQLRLRERRCRDEIEDIYQHRRIERQEENLALLDEDLFAESTWLRLGLSRNQLAVSGMISGGLIGGGIDAALSGATFMTGALVGGAIGGVSAWLTADALAHTKIAGISLGGGQLKAGPVKNQQFPWIALDRALLHLNALRNRAHACRDMLNLAASSSDGIVRHWPRPVRQKIQTQINQLQKAHLVSGQFPYIEKMAIDLQNTITELE
ncbi:GTPase/DUF3482 domain-containing protein [Candidatus Sumerlaeota bacterium]|nr:GTPase/DUF3482 domain-containing protein [Candidatus Sumerlaeota bacterium]